LWLIDRLVLKGLACLFDRRQAEPLVFPRTVVTKPSAGCGLWRHWRVAAACWCCSSPAGAVPDFWSGSSDHEEPSRTGNCHQ